MTRRLRPLRRHFLLVVALDCSRVDHSQRSAWMGSMLDALRAGITAVLTRAGCV